MKTLAKFISEKTPKFNKFMVEGLCYHRVNDALAYIDGFIKYTCTGKTNTHLEYLGYRVMSPKEEIKFLFNKTNKVVYDIARNDIYPVEFMFKYGNEEDVRKYQLYLPYLEKGNVIHLSGNKFLVMPVLADKVISIGNKIVFINILTAKYNFNRTFFSVSINGSYTRVSLVNTTLYKNQSKKLEDTTKARTTLLHYLLANYGYSETMKLLLGFVPQPVYDYAGSDKIVVASTGIPPHGYIGNKTIYKPTPIKFIIDKDKYDENVLYCIGNIYYIIDNFPENISIENLNDTTVWKRLLAEIIHSGNHGLAYLNEKISAHFNDLNSYFDVITIKKLADIGVNANTLMELLVIIFKNFNNWIMNAESRNLYNTKAYEVESFVLSTLTSRMVRIVLDINKEELRMGDGILESKVVDKIFKKHFTTRAIFNLRKEKQYISSIEYCGDHLYPKNTAMVVQQESDFVDVNKQETNTSQKKKIVASMATIGSILGLSKKNPNPIVRLNPYVNVDYLTGNISPKPEHLDIINNTDRLLSNIVDSETIEDTDILHDVEIDDEIELIEDMLEEDFEEDVETIDLD